MHRSGRRGTAARGALAALAALAGGVAAAPPAAAVGAVAVTTGAQLAAAFADPLTTEITVEADLSARFSSRPEGSQPLVIHGGGHTVAGTPGGGLLNEYLNVLTVQDLTMEGFATHALDWYGGGSLTLDGSTFRNNRGMEAVHASADTTLTVRDGTFLDNRSGSILSFGPTKIAGSTFEGNADGSPQSMYVLDGTITGSTFRSSGGIRGSKLTVVDTVVTGNHSSYGAGIQADDLVLERSTVSGNTAALAGGGILAQHARVVNSTISGNQAPIGGGIYADTVSLTYATVLGNSAPLGANLWHGDGLGWFGPSGDEPAFLTAFASVVADPAAGGMSCGQQPGVDGNELISLGFDVEGGGSSCGFDGIDDAADVPDVGLGPLADNGGPTPTHLPRPGSLLVDGIPSGRCQDVPANGISVDQRGLARPQELGCDIGSVEGHSQAGTPPVPTTVPAPAAAAPPAPPPATAIAGSPTFTG